jgi:GTPase SAR1 family protein
MDSSPEPQSQDILSVCRQLQLKGKFGCNAQCMWATAIGHQESLWPALKLAAPQKGNSLAHTLVSNGLLISIGTSSYIPGSARGNTSMGSSQENQLSTHGTSETQNQPTLAELLPSLFKKLEEHVAGNPDPGKPDPGNSVTGNRDATFVFVATWKADGIVVEATSSLERHIREQRHGILLCVPPKSNTVIAMVFDRSFDQMRDADLVAQSNNDLDQHARDRQDMVSAALHAPDLVVHSSNDNAMALASGQQAHDRQTQVVAASTSAAVRQPVPQQLGLTVSPDRSGGSNAHSLQGLRAVDQPQLLLCDRVIQIALILGLTTVDLSHMPALTSLNIDAFLALTNLKSFVCNKCRHLTKIHTNASTTPEASKAIVLTNSSSLESFNVSDNLLLEHLPLEILSQISTLEELTCTGCPLLYTPPQEVCRQGGRETMEFLREVRLSGHVSKHMTLFLIGDGESGKTSTIKALRSHCDVSEPIQEDKRTVGIDISEWSPAGADFTFKIFDLAGQAVYGRTHQLFLQRRAVYMLVWRPHTSLLLDDTSLRRRILHWMDALQFRMPGSYMILVVTHIDTVASTVLDELCGKVKSIVCERMAAMEASARNGVPILHVCDHGESSRVNCLQGQGVAELRSKVVEFTCSMPWYREGIPATWEVTKKVSVCVCVCVCVVCACIYVLIYVCMYD